MGKGGFSAPLPQRCHFASISLPKGFYKNRISARSVLKCFPFETRARLKNNAPATISRGRPQCTACFWKCTNLSLSSHNNDMGLPDGRCSRIRPGTVPSSAFHLFRGIPLLQNINLSFIFNILIYILSGRPIKTKFILEKEFQFHYYLFMDDEETGSIPSPVKLLPRNRHRSREVVGPASQPDADPPPRKQSFGIRQRNFLIHGCFSASRVLIAFSSPKERECKDKTVSSWSTS